MKHYHCIILLAIIHCILSCKAKQVETKPISTGIAGTWLLIEKRAWNGSNWIATSVVSPSPQTLTFTDPHELSAKDIPDAVLAQSRYFDIIAGDLTGPSLIFKKDKDSAVTGFFTYSLTQDTLRITMPSVTAFPFGYSFRRL